MGQRERRRRTGEGYARGRVRDEAARAALEPLGPGERPGAVTVAAVASAVLAVAVLGGAITGTGQEGSLPGGVVVAGLLATAAWGMWRARAWAVLGFLAFLAFQIMASAIALAVVESWWAALLCVVLIALPGWLFWKLIRALARLQMPERPGH